MSRRGGRERYRGSDARRGVFKDNYREIRRHEPQLFAIAPMSVGANRTRTVVLPIDCNHGVPWTECTTCSKPRAG